MLKHLETMELSDYVIEIYFQLLFHLTAEPVQTISPGIGD